MRKIPPHSSRLLVLKLPGLHLLIAGALTSIPLSLQAQSDWAQSNETIARYERLAVALEQSLTIPHVLSPFAADPLTVAVPVADFSWQEQPSFSFDFSDLDPATRYRHLKTFSTEDALKRLLPAIPAPGGLELKKVNLSSQVGITVGLDLKPRSSGPGLSATARPVTGQAPQQRLPQR